MPRKLTTEQFIQKATEIHRSYYDYSRTEYINGKIKVEVLCPKHGSFLQLPSSHLNGCGCLLCGRTKTKKARKLNTLTFTKRSKQIHNNKYSYERVIYTNNSTKVDIFCKRCQRYFFQTPNSHLLGQGCPTCGREQCHKSKRLTTEDFIERAIETHKDFYDYTKTTYKRNDKRITITCPIHGDFTQEAYSHLRGHGCHACSKLGVSQKALRWLNEIEKQYELCLQTAAKGGEFTIPGTKYKADGFCHETNTVYEFYGDKWHGNPKLYEYDEQCHPFSNECAGDLYKKTKRREDRIKALGYNMVTCWETE